jgi:competence ComEA-like helix-hairpin-helix protein
VTGRSVATVAGITIPLVAAAFGATVSTAQVATPAAAAQPVERPAPPAEFTKVCVRCHPSDKIVEGRRYPAQWDQVLEQMVARGAIATDAELDVIYDYLVAQYGRVAINTATADEIAQVLHLEQGAADTIVQYRRKNGAFADFDALARVPELPVADLEKRRDAIVF